MKTLLKIGEMIDHCPVWLKDALHHTAKDHSLKTDDLELHRHSHSEKAAVNQLDKASRKALKYVSARTQDRDDEIVIPKGIDLTAFRRYAHVLVNHNYSLLPIGSDESIEADDFGIKAMTVYADTGEGTMANVCWHLVSQGHMKASSIGFVPLTTTKPGARDWDHVANGLQSDWKEFDKVRAEKSISRIITKGVLLEHSDVSVPCNADAEVISICKSMAQPDVLKQLGWVMRDGVLVHKAEQPPQEKVPCICDECGFVAEAVVGVKCPECKVGSMKLKTKEKAITVLEKGDVEGHEFHGNQYSGGGGSTSALGGRSTDRQDQMFERLQSGGGGGGGPGSGNFGHGGRPGEQGGSSGGDGGGEGGSGSGVGVLPGKTVGGYNPPDQENLPVGESRNPGFGYYGTMRNYERGEGGKTADDFERSQGADRAFAHAREAVVSRYSVSQEDAREALDSRTGRQLADRVGPSGDVASVLADRHFDAGVKAELRRIAGEKRREDGRKAMGCPSLGENDQCSDEDCAMNGKACPGLDKCPMDMKKPVKKGDVDVQKRKSIIKVISLPRSVKVLFAPLDSKTIAGITANAVERALYRRKGKLI